MARDKKISLKDVAGALGVSTTLVSIVLNGKAKQYRIGEEMTEKVLKTVKEMNYSPNITARNLRGGKTQLIGLIVTDISNPFFSSVARVIENRANELNYTVIFGSTDENPQNTQTLIDVFINKGVDGLIIVPCDGSKEIIKKLHESDTPIVLIDRYFPDLDVSFSCLNNYRSTELATRHLIEQNYKKIGLVAYKSEMSNVLDRIAGYEQTMINSGLSEFVNIKKVGFINPQNEIYKAVENLIAKSNVDAIVFSTNTLSIHGLNYINKMKLSVPDQIAVIGFDGSDAFNLFYSPITYIEQPLMEIAEEAVNILVTKIKSGEQNKKSMVVLEPKLVQQSSSVRKT